MALSTKDPKEYGSRMLENLLPLFPEDKRAAVKEAFVAAEAARIKLGESGLRQEDYSRLADEARGAAQRDQKHYDDLLLWHKSVKDEIDSGKKAKSRLAEIESGGGGRMLDGDGNGNGGVAAPDLSGYLKKSDIETLLEERTRELQNFAVNGAATFSQLAVEHYKEFGETLNHAELLEFCRTTGTPVDKGGYQAYVRGARTTRQEAKFAEELKAAEQRGVERGRAETFAPPTFGAQDESGGTLSGLGQKRSSSDAVAAAVSTYHQGVRGKA